MNKLPETNADRCAKQRSLALLAASSCTVRLIYSAAVYLQNTGNAAWIQAIGGMLIALPSFFLLLQERKHGKSANTALDIPKKCVCALFIPFFSFDSASWTFSLAESSSYTTFTGYSLLSLFITALVVTAVIASRGANACGGYAVGAVYVIVFSLGLSAVLQAPEMHPIWLTPILGGGVSAISRGSVLCGGYAALYTAGVWLFLQIDKEEAEEAVIRRYTWFLPLSGIAAMLFLLLYGMLSPNLPYAPHIRSFALERLLTGGGRGTSVHFPSLVGWYTMLLVTAVYSLFCTSLCLKMLFPGRSFPFCCFAGAALSVAWIPVRMFWKHGEDLIVFANVVAVTGAFALLFIHQYRLRKRERLQ